MSLLFSHKLLMTKQFLSCFQSLKLLKYYRLFHKPTLAAAQFANLQPLVMHNYSAKCQGLQLNMFYSEFDSPQPPPTPKCNTLGCSSEDQRFYENNNSDDVTLSV